MNEATTNPLNLAGRVVVVSGASSGIGLATAILLGELGAKVVLAARNKDRLESAIPRLPGSGHRAEAFDFSATDQIPAWLKSISTQTGPIDAVVHCAGTQVIRPLRMLTTADIDGVMKLNVHAAIMLAKGLRQKGVRAENASLVLLSSVMGLVGAPGRAAYCASKSALESLAKSLALELAPEKIRVNCVAPGFVRTPMLGEAEAAVGAEQMQQIENLHPLGFGEPRDVAHAVAFLVAETGRWVTGTTLVIDGGYTAH